MKCKKCNNEVDDKLLICPFCESILNEESKGYHHNYATKSIELGAAKLTEEEIEPEYDLKEKRNNALVLFKSPLFIIINIILLSLYSFGIIYYLSIYHTANILVPIIISLFIDISLVSYELLFYKAYRNHYLGIIPIYRMVVFFQICNDEGSRVHIRKYVDLSLFWGIWLFFELSWLEPFWFMFLNTFLVVLSLVTLYTYIKMRIECLGDLSMRFSTSNDNKRFTILIPFGAILLYAFSKRYHYTKLNDSYL
jgi:hypothetical protein